MRRRDLMIGAGAAAAAVAAGGLSVSRTGSRAEYDAAAAESRARLAEFPDMAELLRFASLAPNSHNTQPWRFRVRAGGVDILPDFARRTPVVDPADHHLFISLGCAAENLALAAGARDRRAVISFETADGGRLACDLFPAGTETSPLFAAIPLRQSTRADYDGQPASADELDQLVAAADVPGAEMVLVTERARMDQVLDVVVAATERQAADPAFVAELGSWVRFNPRQALARRDGLYAGATGSPVTPTWLGEAAFPRVFTPDSENAKYRTQIATSAGLAAFFADGDGPEAWTRVGRCFERFALQAAALGLTSSLVNPPIEVVAFRPELGALVGGGDAPLLLARFGRGPTLPYSLRRPVADVLA